MQSLVPPSIATREEWLTARKALLAEEKAATKVLDAVTAQRKLLPWVPVEENYVFQGPDGPVTLSELFEDKQQLIVHHLMFAPGEGQSCVGCAFQADHTDGPRQHFEQYNIKFVAISRAPYEELVPFKQRMGWKFDWVSSAGSTFNYDYKVSFTPEEVASGGPVGYNFGTSPYAHADLPGMSVFVKDAEGKIYHTYSTFARGLDILITAHFFMDMTPAGREDEDPAGGTLRFHDQYEDAAPAAAECSACEKEGAVA